MNYYITITSALIINFCSWNSFAQATKDAAENTSTDTVKITVHTDEKSAAGIGCSVDGKKLGGPGNFYICEGPKNKTYLFGFRKDVVNGSDVKCGSLMITQDSDVSLVMKGNGCQSVLTEDNAPAF